jgi:CspA family cold shock protein
VTPRPGCRSCTAPVPTAFVRKSTRSPSNRQWQRHVIQLDDGGKDAFVHISAVERTGLDRPIEGQKVEYQVVVDPRSGKAAAENIKKLS